MGNSYEKLGRKQECEHCWDRAENCKDKEGIALHKLAKLYDLTGMKTKAKKCFEENLRRKDEELIIDKELGECLLYLAKFHQDNHNAEKAMYYARRLYDFNGPERDEANTIIYQLNKLEKKK